MARHRLGRRAAGCPPAIDPADRSRISDLKLPRRSPRRRALLNQPDHPNPKIVRIAQAHRWPPSSKETMESYSRTKGNPFDSQQVETALVVYALIIVIGEAAVV